MKSAAFTFLALVVFAMLGAVPAGADDKSTDTKVYKFEWKFPKGETRRFESSQSLKQVMDMGMAKMTMTIETSNIRALTCKSIDEEGVREIEMRYEAVAFKIDMPMVRSEFDSRNMTEEWLNRNPSYRGASRLLDGSFRAFVTPRGEVQKFEGLTELRSQVLRGMTDPARDQFSSLLDEEALRETFRAYSEIPEDGAAIGESWEIKKDLKPADGPEMDIEAAYTLAQVKAEDGGEIATLDFKGSFELKPSDDMEGMEFKVKEQKLEGKMLYNLTEGETIESTNKMSFTIEVETDGGTAAVIVSVDSSNKRLPAKAETTEE
jgi:hypothetical protein